MDTCGRPRSVRLFVVGALPDPSYRGRIVFANGHHGHVAGVLPIAFGDAGSSAGGVQWDCKHVRWYEAGADSVRRQHLRRQRRFARQQACSAISTLLSGSVSTIKIYRLPASLHSSVLSFTFARISTIRSGQLESLVVNHCLMFLYASCQSMWICERSINHPYLPISVKKNDMCQPGSFCKATLIFRRRQSSGQSWSTTN